MNIILGCEESQAVCIEMRKKGHNAYSCDLLPCSGGHPEWHIIADVLEVAKGGTFTTEAGNTVTIDEWDMGIFFPPCPYLTCSAEWAYKDPDYVRYPKIGYHQKLKKGTLFGAERRAARKKAIRFVSDIMNLSIKEICMENPVGVISTLIRKPDQIIHPYLFGDDASKKTCLWLKGLNTLYPTGYVKPRIINGKKRWSNQTDSGQNKLSPSEDRAGIRSKTFPGIAKAMAEQWG